MSPRRFPPPWTVEDIGAAFVVKDDSGQKLTYVYYEDEPGRWKIFSPSVLYRRGKKTNSRTRATKTSIIKTPFFGIVCPKQKPPRGRQRYIYATHC